MSQRQVVALASLCWGSLCAGTAGAASMQKVNQSDWWAGTSGLPSYVNMYIYVPDQPATKPPIVVGPHHCQGTASSSNSEMASLRSVADRTGFIMIFPEATGQNCWDAGSTRSLKHDGKGDTHAIAQMVRYTISKHDADASRVYSVGGSSGGIMTEALLGVYPDIFMAGVSLMGVPCGCWAEQYNDVTGNGNTAQWSGPCAGGNVSKTAQQWGDLVRSYFPGYAGHRPRLQHWHGTADTTLNYKVVAEDIKEWTNVLGLSETPTGTDTPKSGTTRQYWNNSCGYTVYETFSLSGVGHGVPFDGNAIAAYFGLDKAGGQDPEAAACPGSGGSGGAGGATGAGGTTGSGGTSGAGGTSGSGDGGPFARDGGNDVVRAGGGGARGSGGRTGSGGATGTGGGTGSGGSSAAGGAGGDPAGGGSGGSEGSGGASAAGGSGGDGGATGGGVGSGGSSGEAGRGGAGAGGSQASGGASGQGGDAAGGRSTTVGDVSGGCGCALGNRVGGLRGREAALLLAALGSLLRRPRRRTRR
ncbi:MAG: prolyl oligopeptidase family serine peptidase [Deltaproteobacteria bacterium]|nr:prolyl oligopeptidase family serine peptidase [Deltaproteobacteria bacterium]